MTILNRNYTTVKTVPRKIKIDTIQLVNDKVINKKKKEISSQKIESY